MASKFSLEAVLSLTDKLTGPYGTTTRKITGMNAGLSRSFNKLNAGINRGLKRITQVGLVALGAGIAFSTREFIRLDDAITAAGAKFSDVDKTNITAFKESLKELSMAARDVAKVTEFGAVDTAGALDKFALAGFKSTQAMVLLKGTTDLATVANTDLTTSVDIATDTLGAFNLVTEDTVQLEKNLTRVSDVMAKTTTTANTSLEEMFESIKAGGPAFKAAGQEIETFATLTGIMANAGIKGVMSGTSLRNMILRLSKPTGEAADVIKELGIQTEDSQGNFLDIINIIGQFEKGLKGMGSAQRTAALTTVFGARAVTGMNILLAEGSEALGAYREDLINSGGASKTMAEAMRTSLGNRLKVLKSGLTELGLQFIESFELQGRNALDLLIQKIQDFDMKPIIDGAQKAFELIAKWGPVIIDIAPQLLTIAAGVKALALAQGALNIAMSTGPLGAAIIGLTTLVGLLVTLNKLHERNKDIKILEVTPAPGGRRQLPEEFQRAITDTEKFRFIEVEQQEKIFQTRISEENRQRIDLFLNAPKGQTLSRSEGGAPETAVQLGFQGGSSHQ